MYRILLITPCLYFIISSNLYAHQPVMDMAPRWEDGFGVQVRHEFYGSNKLMNGRSKIANPLGLKRFVHKTWFEGVYTFDRSKRVTFKIPYIKQNRIKNIDGAGVKQENRGWGDLILGLPLKHYINQKAGTQNFGITPSVRVPTGSARGNFPISDGSWDAGLSISHSYESPKYYTLVDLFYWANSEGKHDMRAGNELGLDLNLGYHPYHNNRSNSGIFIMWDITARHQDNSSSQNLTTAGGGQRIQTGPILVLYQDNIMFRSEYKYPLYEDKSAISNARGHEFNLGIGTTF